MSLFPPLIAQIAPRVVLPAYFIGLRVKGMSDNALISQTIAFTFLLVAAVNTFFQGPTWLSIIPAIAAIAYYFMLNDPKHTEVYRYSDWALTTPVMLYAILTACKAPLNVKVFTIIFDALMIAAGYVGVKQEQDSKKAAFFAIGTLAFLPILYMLLTQKTNRTAIMLTVAVWTLYPIVYYLDGIHILKKDFVTVSYSIMDMISKIGLVTLLNF
jgi:bacteriorhodopsin